MINKLQLLTTGVLLLFLGHLNPESGMSYERTIQSNGPNCSGLEVEHYKCPQSCGFLDFVQLKVTASDPPVLVVRGLVELGYGVHLGPLVYEHIPEYWGIEVVACRYEISMLPTMVPFVAEIELDGIIGSKGVVVLGDTMYEEIDVKNPKCDGK